MKKTLYYHTVFRRKNALKELFYTLFLALSSWPRLLLEVFVRKNMGERYFSFSTAIIMIFFLFWFPFLVANATEAISFNFSMSHSYGGYSSQNTGFWHVLSKNATWYLFLAGFFYTCLKRRKEVKRLPSVFDFARFSLSTGEVHPQFYAVKIGKRDPDIRLIQTIYEPAFFFAIGLILAFFGQSVGGLIVFCSIVYALSYIAAYHIGDNFVMDTIDEMICNEELVNSFVEGKKPDETRGFSAYGQRPTNPDLRRRVVDRWGEDDDDSDPIEAR